MQTEIIIIIISREIIGIIIIPIISSFILPFVIYVKLQIRFL